MSTRFRITARCARADLELGESDILREAQFLEAKHVAIRGFIGKRSDDPQTGENVLNVSPYGHIKSLHIGKGRAATLYDLEYDVCWLLAYSPTHATGERRDAYKYFEYLDSRQELTPTVDDYANLFSVTDASVMDALREKANSLYRKAVDESPAEAGLTFTLADGQDRSIDIAVEIIVDGSEEVEEGWLRITFPPKSQIDASFVLDLVADLLPPHADLETIKLASDFHGEPVSFNEIAVTWGSYRII